MSDAQAVPQSPSSVCIHPANGYQADLLNIATRGEIKTSVKDGALALQVSIPNAACNDCPRDAELLLRFDRDSNSLALELPAAGNIALFKYLRNTAQAFNY